MTYDDAINEAIASAGPDFQSAVLAEKLVARIEEQDPASLDEWLHARAAAITTMEISARLRSIRARHVHRASARSFAEAVEAAEDGDTEPLTHFAVVYQVSDDHVRRPVGQMNGPDHLYVAGAYQASGKRDLMLAAFHRAVAKKVGKRTTAEVFSEAQYHDLLHSIAGRAA